MLSTTPYPTIPDQRELSRIATEQFALQRDAKLARRAARKRTTDPRPLPALRHRVALGLMATARAIDAV